MHKESQADLWQKKMEKRSTNVQIILPHATILQLKFHS